MGQENKIYIIQEDLKLKNFDVQMIPNLVQDCNQL